MSTFATLNDLANYSLPHGDPNNRAWQYATDLLDAYRALARIFTRPNSAVATVKVIDAASWGDPEPDIIVSLTWPGAKPKTHPVSSATAAAMGLPVHAATNTLRDADVLDTVADTTLNADTLLVLANDAAAGLDALAASPTS